MGSRCNTGQNQEENVKGECLLREDADLSQKELLCPAEELLDMIKALKQD